MHISFSRCPPFSMFHAHGRLGIDQVDQRKDGKRNSSLLLQACFDRRIFTPPFAQVLNHFSPSFAANEILMQSSALFSAADSQTTT
ncbi:hypothetical protein E1B28_002899 [Marasmius oreades]|uniref:Uncharacterized protein n=1 Tax=Marasmius oreades TaxID=181124 RepID=A0A9P7RLX2_9AGAR|nr:uncharacterized protein E1B28_002899 [Marasmius oreades]KAG7085333.1 hypothetical protein E1B28_002899 [Marasmius oreades]